MGTGIETMTEVTANDPTDESTGECDRRLQEGWQGRFFEDFAEGDIYKHPYGRTVTETDTVWLTNVTMNLNPIHFNEPYAADTEFDRGLNGLVVERTTLILKREVANPSAVRPPGWPEGIGTQSSNGATEPTHGDHTARDNDS